MCTSAMIRSVFVGVLLLMGALSAQAADVPLASWNDTATKQAIVDFVTAVTDEKGKDFVPAAERIAVFDNDGTLWAEKPEYVHVYALLDRVKELMAADPTLMERQPYKAIAAKDKEYFADLYEGNAIDTLTDELIALPFGGLTTGEYTAWVRTWMEDWKHPKIGVGVAQLTYKPMVELIDYLEANGFTVYIFTADEGAFLRVVAQDLYGLAPDRTYGSRVRTDYISEGGKSELVRSYRLEFLDNWTGKPQLIETVIGVRPILAGGNSNGDEHMLQYTALQDRRSLSLLVHHTDGEREFAYDSHTDKVLPRAANEGWTVIDMKNDWKTVFSTGK